MNKEKLPKRKKLRLKGYDYSQNGCYFVTVCVKDKRHLLAHYKSRTDIVGAIHEAPVNHAENRCINLNQNRKLVERAIQGLHIRFDEITVDNYIVMPNHIHMLVSINNDIDSERAIRESPLQRSLLSKAVGYIKMNVSKEIHKTNPRITVWQRGYVDHIIRNQQDFEYHWNYIEYNALKEYK